MPTSTRTYLLPRAEPHPSVRKHVKLYKSKEQQHLLLQRRQPPQRQDYRRQLLHHHQRFQAPPHVPRLQLSSSDQSPPILQRFRDDPRQLELQRNHIRVTPSTSFNRRAPLPTPACEPLSRESVDHFGPSTRRPPILQTNASAFPSQPTDLSRPQQQHCPPRIQQMRLFCQPFRVPEPRQASRVAASMHLQLQQQQQQQKLQTQGEHTNGGSAADVIGNIEDLTLLLRPAWLPNLQLLDDPADRLDARQVTEGSYPLWACAKASLRASPLQTQCESHQGMLPNQWTGSTPSIRISSIAGIQDEPAAMLVQAKQTLARQVRRPLLALPGRNETGGRLPWAWGPNWWPVALGA